MNSWCQLKSEALNIHKDATHLPVRTVTQDSEAHMRMMRLQEGCYIRGSFIELGTGKVLASVSRDGFVSLLCLFSSSVFKCS